MSSWRGSEEKILTIVGFFFRYVHDCADDEVNDINTYKMISTENKKRRLKQPETVKTCQTPTKQKHQKNSPLGDIKVTMSLCDVNKKWAV